MNIYRFVRTALKVNSQEVVTSKVQVLVGTLRIAGFSDTLTVRDQAMATSILKTRMSTSSKVRTANADVVADIMTPDRTQDRFREIEALIAQGKCPRCKSSNVTSVKLSEYDPGTKRYMSASFCKNCRTIN